MNIECEVEFELVENEENKWVPGVMVTCPECGVMTESYGQGGPSIRRCLALMREECECDDGTYKFYTAPGDDR